MLVLKSFCFVTYIILHTQRNEQVSGATAVPSYRGGYDFDFAGYISVKSSSDASIFGGDPWKRRYMGMKKLVECTFIPCYDYGAIDWVFM